MKRLFDLIFSILGLIVAFIPLVIISLVVKLTSKGPAIHWSKRIGKDNEFFMMPKFRTMYTDAPQVATHLLNDSQKFITPVGKFLRKTSLDELPQLWSVLVGDMSFVGPRPALFNQDDLKAMRTECGVHKLTPGITGWAQINGRDEIPLDIKVDLDKFYLDHMSIVLDLKILFLTVAKVALKKDISH